MRSTLFALSAMVMAPTLAAGASSDWIETEGGRVRLVVLPEQADGQIPALLDVHLKPGWKTYWRDPGQSGIPPSVSIPDRTGLVLESMRFPVPKQFDDGYSRYTGYDQSVAFPLTLKRKDPAVGSGEVTASIFLGVCKEICIPVQTELTVDLNAAAMADPGDETIVAAAEADLPEPPSPDFNVRDARWDDEGKSLSITFTAPAQPSDTPPQVFVSGPDGFQFGTGAMPQRVGDAYRVDVPLLHKPKSASLAGAAILFTAESGDRSMETPLAID
ncbi:protein-disulfide reductase DsbD domain-containing protein [Mycoplana ramosa]|uniref:Protein-disulfide reductase DsbD domain-containing protein n=1 Tax=Mycoplana ramosa TaxID=40837 RepID=A0ABW3YT05_MYCRA